MRSLHFHDCAVAFPKARETATSSVISSADEDRLLRDGVCGIVLAGSPRWGDGSFERALRGPLLPVAHAPIIRYPLEWLRNGGVRSAVICANSSTAAVRACFGDGESVGLKLDYVEDAEPRGPAGCAHDAARRSAAHTFIVVEGTMIPTLDISALLEAHRGSGAAATVVVEVERRKRALWSDAPRLAGGAYVFSRRVLEGVAARGFQDIKQGLLEHLYAAGEQVRVHEVPGMSPRVLDYPSYAAVSRWLISRAVERPTFLPEYLPVGAGLWHPSARVDRRARIIGPVLIAERARVEAGAVVIGPSSIGVDSVIRADAVLSRAIVWNHCVVESAALVYASLLADHITIGRNHQVLGAVELGTTVPPGVPEVTIAPAAARPRGVRRQPVRLPAQFIFPSVLAGEGRGDHERVDRV
jgi:NDP-sugar pyrophosphorylase family protein